MARGSRTTRERGRDHGPHIWRAEAARALEQDTSTAGRVAREYARAAWDGETLVTALAVNAGWEPPQRQDEDRGAAPDGPELPPAERGITRRTLAELVMADTLRAWTLREAAARGGNRALAAALVAAEPAPLLPRDRQVKNMLRKVEEWAQGKYLRPGGRNKRRVDALRGDVDAHGARIVALARATIGLTGRWRLGRDDQRTRTFRTDPYDEADVRAARAVLAADGAGFAATVTRRALRTMRGGSEVELERVYALHVEVTPPAPPAPAPVR